MQIVILAVRAQLAQLGGLVELVALVALGHLVPTGTSSPPVPLAPPKGPVGSTPPLINYSQLVAISSSEEQQQPSLVVVSSVPLVTAPPNDLLGVDLLTVVV